MDRSAQNLDKTVPQCAWRGRRHWRGGLLLRRRIQTYFLYGEPQRDVASDFLHLEDLDERSRPSGWNIRPHAHAALAHVFSITSGSGRMSADGASTCFAAPALLLVPPRAVHAFFWQPDTKGQVLTLSARLLARLLAATPELAGLFDRPAHIDVPPASLGADAISHLFTRLKRELSWSAPARDRALEACLTTLLLDALRLHLTADEAAGQAARTGARLTARFAATVEAGFRTPRRLAAYADALGVAPAALRAATRAVTGRPPSAMLRERQVLEAKRLLLYSDIGVAEAAYALGFEDPAYFSRVFRNATGSSPRAYRRDHGPAPASAKQMETMDRVEGRHSGGNENEANPANGSKTAR